MTLSYEGRDVQREYPVTVKNVVELEIENGPSTTLYYEGEKFNPQNLRLKATFSDNTTKTIMSNEFTYSPAGETDDCRYGNKGLVRRSDRVCTHRG